MNKGVARTDFKKQETKTEGKRTFLGKTFTWSESAASRRGEPGVLFLTKAVSGLWW